MTLKLVNSLVMTLVNHGSSDQARNLIVHIAFLPVCNRLCRFAIVCWLPLERLDCQMLRLSCEGLTSATLIY